MDKSIYEVVTGPDGKERVVAIPEAIGKYVQARLSGKSQGVAAAENAGSITRIYQADKDGSIREYFRQRLAEEGLGDDKTIRVLRDALVAERYVNKVDEEIIMNGKQSLRTKKLRTVSVADHRTRLDALTLKLQLEGSLGKASDQETTHTTTNQTINLIAVQELSKKDHKEILRDMVSRARATKQRIAYNPADTPEPPREEEFDGDVPSLPTAGGIDE